MRTKTRWFDINIEFSGESASIQEKDCSYGKYCRRKDVEPLLLSYEKKLKQYDKIKEVIMKNLKGKGFMNLPESEKSIFRQFTVI